MIRQHLDGKDGLYGKAIMSRSRGFDTSPAEILNRRGLPHWYSSLIDRREKLGKNLSIYPETSYLTVFRRGWSSAPQGVYRDPKRRQNGFRYGFGFDKLNPRAHSTSGGRTPAPVPQVQVSKSAWEQKLTLIFSDRF